MIYRSTLEQITDYYNNPSINQSSIVTLLLEGVQSFLDKQENLRQQEEGLIPKTDAEHFNIGKASEYKACGFTNLFQRDFHVSKLIKKPTGKSLDALNLAYLRVEEKYGTVGLSFDEYVETINAAAIEADFYADAKYTNSRMSSLFKNGGMEYWNDMIEAQGKIVLSEKEDQTAEAVANNFETHPHTAHLFENGEGKDLIYQFPCYWVQNDIPCKALLDIIYVSHVSKTIYPIDMKTTSDYVLRFNRAIRKRRYDIQGAFYYAGIRACLKELSKLIGVDVTNYKLANFHFIVASTCYIRSAPMTFILDNDMMELGKVGDSKFYPGWFQGLQILQDWRLVGFIIEERFKKTNGRIEVGRDFLYNENF